jgi:molecular chaperone DnaK (HSP70)
MRPDMVSLHKIVVGIDFGTSRTGYQFAFTSVPEEVFGNKTWPEAPEIEVKTLTELLLKRDLTPVAFGYEARNMFANFDEQQAAAHLYFKNFKMALWADGTSVRSSSVRAVNSTTEVKVIDLVSISLKFVKEKALVETASASVAQIDASEVLWVVTVPAIWDTAARQFMLDACSTAGLANEKGSNVMIALEPEAASLCCLRGSQVTSPLDIRASSYMVIDAGGGTVDITVHHNLGDAANNTSNDSHNSSNNNNNTSNNHLGELVPPSGGDWGSTYVNSNFTKLLTTIFGKSCIDDIVSSPLWLKIIDDFEQVKVNFQGDDSSFKNVNLGALLSDWNLQKSPSALVEEYNASQSTDLKLVRGVLRIPSSVIQKLFEPMLSNICLHVENLLRNPAVRNLKYIFLVGGFAQSLLLQKKISTTFGSRIKVVTPPRSGIAVGTGAVFYGMDPEAIESRIMRYTVGIKVSEPWEQSKHSGHNQITADGMVYCADLFHEFIECGEAVNVQGEVSHYFTPLGKDSTRMLVSVYSATVASVTYVTEATCRKIGELLVEVPDTHLPVEQRIVDVVMKFGGPTFSVMATYRRTKVVVKAQFSFFLNAPPITGRS